MVIDIMLGNNREELHNNNSTISLELAFTCNIKVMKIWCIGNTEANGELNVYFSNDPAGREFSCNPRGASLFLLVCSLPDSEIEKIVPHEDDLSNSNSVCCSNLTTRRNTLHMYFLIKEEDLEHFVRDVYFKILRGEQKCFDNVGIYGHCIMTRLVKENLILGTDVKFDESNALKDTKIDTLLRAKYISYDSQKEEIRNKKSLEDYKIYGQIINNCGSIIVKKAKCIGNTDSQSQVLKIYVTKNLKKINPVPCGKSLFVLKSILPYETVKGYLSLVDLLEVFKKESIFYRRNTLSFNVYLVVCEDKLHRFLSDIYVQDNLSVSNISQYGKVVFAIPTGGTLLYPESVAMEAMKTELETLDEDETVSKGQLFSSRQKVGNYSKFSSMDGEEKDKGSSTTSGSMFSRLGGRVNTLFSNITPLKEVQYRGMSN